MANRQVGGYVLSHVNLTRRAYPKYNLKSPLLLSRKRTRLLGDLYDKHHVHGQGL
jgi:hypothetical protein